MIIAICEPVWKAEGRGITLSDDTQLTRVVWADNIYFFDVTAEGVQTMVKQFTAEMNARTLAWKSKSLTYFATDMPAGYQLMQIETDKGIEAIVSAESMEVLGTVQHCSGDNLPDVSNRLNKGTAAYWKFSHTLHNREVPLMQKVQLYSQRVLKTAIFGSAAWRWSLTTAQRLRTWER